MVIQSVIMLLIAAVMFYNFSQSQSVIFLVLMAFAMAFVAIYFYRIFFMRVVFEANKITFKGFVKQHAINKEDIVDIHLLKQVGREVNTVKYLKGGDYKTIEGKAYILIRKNSEYLQTNLSMFNAACDDYITLEYTPGIEKYLDTLLDKQDERI